MLQLAHFVESPRICSYLPQETASLEIRAISELSPVEYEDLLARGYRRFGWQVLRPACPNCFQCRSLRVLVQHWRASRSEARVLRKNQGIRAELHPLFVTREHIQLHNLYHRFMHQHRGWPLQTLDPNAFRDQFLSGAVNVGRQWLYFEEDRLIGVAMMDAAPRSISLVYFFYDPGWRARSPGTFSILNQLLYAQSSGLDYAYLGYWIEACPSMSYKGRFRPREILSEYPNEESAPVWVPDPVGAGNLRSSPSNPLR
jgi:arginyl-tRNA--protein-N-Asp/Glu arginylyltransferase